MLTGSVEDGLALHRLFTGATAWASLSDANLGDVLLPPIVRSIVIYGGTDDLGRAAAERLPSHAGAQTECRRRVPNLARGRECQVDGTRRDVTGRA